MRDPRVREELAEQYRRAWTISATLIATAYERVGEEPPLPPRDLAIVIEALGIGMGFQALVDAEDVELALHGDVLAKLLRLPLPDASARPVEPNAGD